MNFNSSGQLTFDSETDSLTSAVLVSLFSNRDQWYIRSMGTYLYKALRMKMNQDDINELKASVQESLLWLTEDNIVNSYSVELIKSFDKIEININIVKLDNTNKLITTNI